MFDAKDEGNLVDELQVGKTYWFRIWHQSELQTSQDVGVLVQMIDKNKDVDNILQKIDGHSIHDPHDQMENGFEWTPKYVGEFLITAELFTKDGPFISNYSEFEFVTYGNLSLKQQIENNMSVDKITCSDNEKHVLVVRPNAKFACVYQSTVDKLGWSKTGMYEHNENLDSLSLHTPADQKKIDLWEDCRFGNHATILERFPALCILDDNSRYEQPIFFATTSQWESCIALENSIILDDDIKCIAPNEVVYYMKK